MEKSQAKSALTVLILKYRLLILQYASNVNVVKLMMQNLRKSLKQLNVAQEWRKQQPRKKPIECIESVSAHLLRRINTTACVKKSNCYTENMKVVGKRKPSTQLKIVAGIQNLLLDLRKALGLKKFIPKGVYRFKTFEEAQKWSLKMTTRRQNR